MASYSYPSYVANYSSGSACNYSTKHAILTVAISLAPKKVISVSWKPRYEAGVSLWFLVSVWKAPSDCW